MSFSPPKTTLNVNIDFPDKPVSGPRGNQDLHYNFREMSQRSMLYLINTSILIYYYQFIDNNRLLILVGFF